MVKFNRKAQSLPLNTIVIALLVVIVLVVIVLAFTSNIGNANNTINENSASTCSLSNPAVSAFGYTKVEEKTNIDVTGQSLCESPAQEITVLRKITTDATESTPAKATICCGTR